MLVRLFRVAPGGSGGCEEEASNCYHCLLIQSLYLRLTYHHSPFRTPSTHSLSLKAQTHPGRPCHTHYQTLFTYNLAPSGIHAIDLPAISWCLSHSLHCYIHCYTTMPPSSTVAAKKQPLTLAQLSTYDDILTDALVDHVSEFCSRRFAKACRNVCAERNEPLTPLRLSIGQPFQRTGPPIIPREASKRRRSPT